MLRVRIDGGPERWFVLDSGCPVTAVDMALARELKLPVKVRGQIGGAGEGTTTLGTTSVRSLSLPGLELFPKTVWALAVNEPVSPFEWRRLDGLLGVDFLERFVVRIDYPARRLDVFSPEAFRPDGKGVAVPLEKRGGLSSFAFYLRFGTKEECVSRLAKLKQKIDVEPRRYGNSRVTPFRD